MGMANLEIPLPKPVITSPAPKPASESGVEKLLTNQ